MSFDNVPAIKIEGVSKCYAVFNKPSDRLRQMVSAALRRFNSGFEGKYFEPFWALRDVSFTVARGECVAIVGRNGSGKSTLLQLVTGTLEPTAGRVDVQGRVAALLELGSGFNPEFTGIENIYLNGSLLGMSRAEVDERMDAILAFADIGDFVYRPVKTYSSGMTVRLAFAVQAQIDPDVLIVDEALAVGDARFQAKCFARLKELREKGTTILLVSHSTEQIVTHCDRAILLDAGFKRADGEPRAVVNQYLDILYGRSQKSLISGHDSLGSQERQLTMPVQLESVDPEFFNREEANFEKRTYYNTYEHRWGDRCAEIMDVAVINGDRLLSGVFNGGDRMDIYVRYRLLEDVKDPIFGMTLKTKEGLTVYGTNSEFARLGVKIADRAGKNGVIRFSFNVNCAPGDYFISLGIASRGLDGDVIPHDRRYDSVHFYVGRAGDFIGVTDLRATIEVV